MPASNRGSIRRERHYRMQQDGLRQDSGLCAAHPADTERGPLWYLRRGADADSVPRHVRHATVTVCRELAFQIADQFRAFGRPIGLKDAVVVGGLGSHDMHACIG